MKRRLFLVGAAGHAKMVIESAMRDSGAWHIDCCLDRPGTPMKRLHGIAVREESTESFSEMATAKALGFVAIGDNRIRRRQMESMDAMGIGFAAIIDPTAVVSPSATIGQGSIIMPRAVIGADCKIGRGVIVNTCCHIDHDGVIGDFCHLAPGSHIAGSVGIGDGCFVGVGACVIDKISIGEWTIIGAGTIVIRNIPEREVWVGNPARFLKRNA